MGSEPISDGPRGFLPMTTALSNRHHLVMPNMETVMSSTVSGSIINGASALSGLPLMEVAEMSKLKNIHPGEVLLEEFLAPLGLSQNRVARETGVPPRRINEIVLGKRSITADTALRLARYFGTSEGFWMGLQADFDLEEARNRLGKRLQTDVRIHVA